MLHEGRREKRPICLAEDRDTSFSLSLPFPLSTPFRIFETGPIPFPRTVPQNELGPCIYDVPGGRGCPKNDFWFLNVNWGRVSDFPKNFVDIICACPFPRGNNLLPIFHWKWGNQPHIQRSNKHRSDIRVRLLLSRRRIKVIRLHFNPLYVLRIIFTQEGKKSKKLTMLEFNIKSRAIPIS